MFLTRLASSIILLAVTIFTVVMGGNVLLSVLGVISIIGMYELYRIVQIEKTPLAISSYLACICFYACSFLKWEHLRMAVMIFTLLLVLLLFVVSFPAYQAEHVFLTYFGFVYVAVLLSFIYETRMLQDGVWLVWLIFIGAWGSDTCAYTVGILIGKHKMTPKLSPKKSIEGGIGGVVGAALIGAIYGLVMGRFVDTAVNLPLSFAIIGGVGSILSQVGDLAASGIKRCFQIKDYGNLIPGHGGILDRFDSILVTAPIVYYLALLFVS